MNVFPPSPRVTAAAGVLLAVGLLSGVWADGLYTDTASAGSNMFSAGTVDLSLSPGSAFLTVSGMVPGDVLTAPLTVTNAGTASLRYAVRSTTTEDTLAGQLSLTVKSGVTTCTTDGFGASGTVVRAAGVLGSVSGIGLLGDPAQGSQAGDRILAASTSETLCFQATLPLSTGNAFESTSTTATFAFSAEQSLNNP